MDPHLERSPVDSIFLIPQDIVVEIFLCLGAIGTARCSMSCRRWNMISNDSRALWQHFTNENFCVFQRQHGDEAKVDTIKWVNVYRYISSCLNENTVSLPARVIFSDDGSAYHGYPPENVFDPQEPAWCTNRGVDHNVDLVVELPTTCIVTEFIAENGGRYYSAPLREALVFLSLEDPPDLQKARKYNDEEGSKWVTDLIDQRSSNAAIKNLETSAKSEKVKGVQCSAVEQQQHPIAAFQFSPIYEQCIETQISFLCEPRVTRYIHFKLLNSVHPEGMYSTNIDIKNLTIRGVELSCLPEMLQCSQTQESTNQRTDPSYERFHTYIPSLLRF
eukprot:CAMPEP_0194358392 /NCGR_PEP_ID=MMETSP0174-20130528/5614_1 /TAXON_ID=216777 /ORGANISM="Proboscia alata, Strain PI-D3" /LENGTH=331 /DNA_ID=CAMNT_0039128691 /DNA_START=63 /DNA_END=1058 /DNA_ORIENTATION=+